MKKERKPRILILAPNPTYFGENFSKWTKKRHERWANLERQNHHVDSSHKIQRKLLYKSKCIGEHIVHSNQRLKWKLRGWMRSRGNKHRKRWRRKANVSSEWVLAIVQKWSDASRRYRDTFILEISIDRCPMQYFICFIRYNKIRAGKMDV